MIDTDTVLTALYVIVDDICNSDVLSHTASGHSSSGHSSSGRLSSGPRPRLATSEVVTLAMFAQVRRFSSERDFYRFAQRNLRSAFPGLPDRTRYNRLARAAAPMICRVGLQLAEMLGGNRAIYQAVDTTAAPTRQARRRGNGWFCGQADIGYSNRLGWFEGFRLLAAADPCGVITGFCFTEASVNDRHIAEAFFGLRHHPDRRAEAIGRSTRGLYLLDKGFHGVHWHQRWREAYDATVLCAPQRTAQHRGEHPWPQRLRRWLSGHRQIIETVFQKLHECFGLHRDRPHQLDGFMMRVTAKVAMHNFCIWMNRQVGRADLAFVEIVALA